MFAVVGIGAGCVLGYIGYSIYKSSPYEIVNGVRYRKQPNGELILMTNSMLHSINDRPAIISPDGSLHWYWNNLRHRPGGRPAVIWANGVCMWFEYGFLHRENQPAVWRPNGDVEYCRNGHHHREDGPALITSNYVGYYRNGSLVIPRCVKL